MSSSSIAAAVIPSRQPMAHGASRVRGTFPLARPHSALRRVHLEARTRHAQTTASFSQQLSFPHSLNCQERSRRPSRRTILYATDVGGVECECSLPLSMTISLSPSHPPTRYSVDQTPVCERCPASPGALVAGMLVQPPSVGLERDWRLPVLLD